MVTAITYVLDGLDVVAELQEQLSIFLLDAELLDVESTEPVEQVQRLQGRLDATDARLHERVKVRLLHPRIFNIIVYGRTQKRCRLYLCL